MKFSGIPVASRVAAWYRGPQPNSSAIADEDAETSQLYVDSSAVSIKSSKVWLRQVDALAVMADHLFQSAMTSDWTRHPSRTLENTRPCVAVRYEVDGAVAVRPACPDEGLLSEVLVALEVKAVLVLENNTTVKLVERIAPMSKSIVLTDGRSVQVVESYRDVSTLLRPGKSGFCLLRSPQAAVVWTSEAKSLIEECKACDLSLKMMLWKHTQTDVETWAYKPAQVTNEKSGETSIQIREVSDDASVKGLDDLELQGFIATDRPTRLVWPISVALTFILIGLILGKSLSDLVLAVIRDGSYTQLVFMLYFPVQCFLAAFFLSIIIVGVLQLVGPVIQMETNSRTFSGKRLEFEMAPVHLPHITIQCPIYKEDLVDVIMPTIDTVREAIATYQSQGGTASIIVNDDGLRAMTEEQQETRKAYYFQNNIGWIARPKHGENGFVRKGAFKKASNLNFGIRTSLAVEKRFETLTSRQGASPEKYLEAMQSVIDDSYGEIRASGDIGLGEIILLIDADTRIPRDCFLDAVKEFYDTPSLAILQHPSGVLQVVNNFWENSLAHFTRNNYFGTRYVVSGGDATPFFGHNAFLRFSAIADVAELGNDGQPYWWSEDHVSEDFELSLKLLSSGYSTRMVGYSKGEFQEGVCLTVYDELNRWEKYAYGVSEMMMHPLIHWFRRGPFTPLFRHFLSSNMDLSAKCSTLFYMGTYYGIGLTWILCVVNYFLVGWFPEVIRSYYIDSLQVLISVSVIFGLKDAIVGPLVQYRMKEVTLFRGIVNSLNHFVITSLFLQGISMHVSKCLLWHLCGFKMSWDATNKSVSDTATLFQDLPIIWKRFRVVYVLVAILSGVLIVLATAVPHLWQIRDIKAILPLAWMLFWHASVPLLMHNRSFLAESRRFTVKA